MHFFKLRSSDHANLIKFLENIFAEWMQDIAQGKPIVKRFHLMANQYGLLANCFIMEVF